MQPTPPLTRRHLLGGMAGIVATTVAGVSPARAQFGPATFLSLAAFDFRPHSSDSYVFVSPSGIRATSGDGRFGAGLRLPVGSRILNARVYLNPNGQARNVFLTRFNPLTSTGDILMMASSTAGSIIETVVLALTHDVADDWNYHIIADIQNGGAHLFGARIRYRPPV
jgi:hypothetical protein